MTILPVALVALALFGSFAGPQTPPVDPGLDVSDRMPGVVHVLGPGQTAQWPIGVTTSAVRLESLSVRVTTPSGQDSRLNGSLSFSVRGCTSRWLGANCPAIAIDVAPTMTAVAWHNHQAEIQLPDGTVPRDVELLLAVSLAADATNAVRGERGQVVIEVSALGEPVDGHVGPGNWLPSTGLALYPPVLVACAAIAAGLALAAMGKRWAESRR
ncbi:hypothetical protein SAMN04515671_3904 [Nakamurella panacisegetis]|uniref:Uncharacterized protein n=1 Tax=Nakamurella panacisegetis TaxID=1090615 RepID=A0A1H0S4S8_9ACTN|nr:hypothetical protein [Nakamurella panacisegetis]SDP36694.1 hypothetical protein SAMN04515671_3904 [Nakamurella panacisegetis]